MYQDKNNEDLDITAEIIRFVVSLGLSWGLIWGVGRIFGIDFSSIAYAVSVGTLVGITYSRLRRR